MKILTGGIVREHNARTGANPVPTVIVRMEEDTHKVCPGCNSMLRAVFMMYQAFEKTVMIRRIEIMDFMDISKLRVTVRKFEQAPVEKEKIDKILEAGRWSPTAVDFQPQRILVLDTKQSLEKVKEFCTFGYDEKYRNIDENCGRVDSEHNVYYYGSPLVFIVCYDKTVCWQHPVSGESSGVVDGTIVATHMMLEAASIGLGTVWISYFDKDKARNLLNIPDNYEILSMLYVGYAAKDYEPNRKISGKRFPIEHTCFNNSFEMPYITDFHDNDNKSVEELRASSKLL